VGDDRRLVVQSALAKAIAGEPRFQASESMTHPNLESPRRPGSSRGDAGVHDWRLRNRAAEAAAAEIKWPQLLAFDSFIRARLAAILVRREAERAAEGGLSSDVRARVRTQLGPPDRGRGEEDAG
jgi:hypothetical protein